MRGIILKNTPSTAPRIMFSRLLVAFSVAAAISIPQIALAEFGGNLKKAGKLISDKASNATKAGQEMLQGPPPEEQRAELQEARTKALNKLISLDPGMQGELDDAIGYAVFSNIGINLLLVSTQRGGGILHDNRSGGDTYMKMFSAGGGFGLGLKEFAAIFVFHTDRALDEFVSEGWDFSAQADANATYNEQGEGIGTAATVMPGTSLYQITESGLAAQVTLQGTKFWADDLLNGDSENP